MVDQADRELIEGLSLSYMGGLTSHKCGELLWAWCDAAEDLADGKYLVFDVVQPEPPEHCGIVWVFRDDPDDIHGMTFKLKIERNRIVPVWVAREEVLSDNTE